MMFVHHCTACEKDQLIFPSQFTGVAREAAGTVATFTCWCGADQTHVLGSTRPAATSAGVELAA